MSKIRNPERLIQWQSPELRDFKKSACALEKALCPLLLTRLDDAQHHFIEEVWERGLFHSIAYLRSWNVIGDFRNISFHADIESMMMGSFPTFVLTFAWQHRNRKPQRSLVLRLFRHHHSRPPQMGVVSFHASIAEIEAMFVEVQKTWAQTHDSVDPLLKCIQAKAVSGS
jgi:hypothetical protein